MNNSNSTNIKEISKTISKNIVLALATEPLADKEELTTRYIDSSPNAKLQYFIVGAINIQWSFFDLSNDFLSAQVQPKSIFAYALQAQKNTVLNRGGGKVTFGQTLLLIPLVAAHLQSLVEGNSFTDIECIKPLVKKILINTGESDVKDLEEFCLLAISQSKKSNDNHKIGRKYPNPSFVGKYNNIVETFQETEFSQLTIVKEIEKGYEIVFEIFEEWKDSGNTDILELTEKTYSLLRPKYGRGDIVADFIAAAMYLFICHFNKNILYP